MSAMTGNPFVKHVEVWAHPQNSLEALATLALAYEQRTANLIALYAFDWENTESLTKDASMTSEDWLSIAKQITERLGLTK